ncbi:unnamed protein product [Spirodela intermedia]|uniref:Uncharacterized protein n=1 Tax=Spirodela intermedia TaxID=51605 RepID=A0A7I8K9N0_SPIIN|nr:unnamed protein product [Spirodela intermedia]
MADDGKGLRHPPRGIASAVAATGGAAASPPGTGRDPLPPEAKTFSASISTDLPLYDTPEASFDEYLDDRPRIFRAMFPDRRRSRQLNEEEWKVQMLPIEFLFASVNPVVVMRLRCCSHGEDHPLEVPPHITRALDLRVTRWELRGLDMAHSPRHFGLDVRGLLYPDRGEGGAAAAAAGGRRSRLRGRLQMSISFVLPPVLSLVPEQVLRGVADSVLRRLLQKMKDDVNGGLLSDFQSFRRERMKEKQLLKKPAQRQLLRPDPDQTP